VPPDTPEKNVNLYNTEAERKKTARGKREKEYLCGGEIRKKRESCRTRAERDFFCKKKERVEIRLCEFKEKEDTDPFEKKKKA